MLLAILWGGLAAAALLIEGPVPDEATAHVADTRRELNRLGAGDHRRRAPLVAASVPARTE